MSTRHHTSSLPDLVVVGIDRDPNERNLGHNQVPEVECAASDEPLSATCGSFGITCLRECDWQANFPGSDPVT